MAAMVFRYLAQQRHVSGEFEVDSAALSSEEIGNGIYPPARRILVKHGVPCTEHRARQITPEDFETADLIIGMEWGHLKKLRALCPKEQQAKLHLLLDFAERQGDIEDPWYTDDFRPGIPRYSARLRGPAAEPDGKQDGITKGCQGAKSS